VGPQRRGRVRTAFVREPSMLEDRSCAGGVTVAYHKTEAVVLRRVDYSETSLVLTLFTREAGLLRGIAKGAKRSRSLFDAGLEPFVRSLVVYLDRQSRGLHILTEAAVLETFPGLRERLDRVNAAWLAAELVPAVSEESDPQPALYALLVGFLHALESSTVTEPLLLAFSLQVLAQTGYRPQMDRCVGCGAPLSTRKVKLSPRLGGFVCPACEQSAGRLLAMSQGARSALRNFLLSPLKAVEKVRLSPTMNKECFAAVGALLTELLGAPLRCWSLVVRGSGRR